jgi:hypothetical protein
MDKKIKSVNLRVKDFKFAEQENTQWCWAASIHNILKYHGIEKAQNLLVACELGQVENWFSPNQSVTIKQIAGFLNSFNILNFNVNYKLIPLYCSRIMDNIIIAEIENNRPILYLFNNNGLGHVSVVVGADYYEEQTNKIIDTLYFFDPWPGNGFKNLSITELKSCTAGYWTLRIEKD